MEQSIDGSAGVAAAVRWDEWFEADSGAVRPMVAPLVDYLADMPVVRLQAHRAEIRRLLRERGERSGGDLELLPMLLGDAHWAWLSGAVVQRAELLDRIVTDLYGPQQLLREGLLPAALIHAHSGFLRPCARQGLEALAQPLPVQPAGHRHALGLYAVDLARAPDGSWWVLADHPQAPAGLGTALENRMAMARALPELYEPLQVRPLEDFFARLRAALVGQARRCQQRQQGAAAAARADAAPLVVLLSPGPQAPGYGEQAFLARWLGFPLALGSDLTVRDGKVWLKTVAGLQRVWGILRQLSDANCDPLELNADSVVGVAGLLEAERADSVALINALGGGILDSGALMGYLPLLASRLLGGPLQLPSVATWWCGEAAACASALQQMDQLVFRPAWAQPDLGPVVGAELQGEARERFIQQLQARPERWIAQEMVHVGQVPCWAPERDAAQPLRPAPVVVRLFAVATHRGWEVMPGGVVRLVPEGRMRTLPPLLGADCKDLWICPEPDVTHPGSVRWRPDEGWAGAEASTPDTEVPMLGGRARSVERLASRTVENLYWFGRYSERCDHLARLLRRTLEIRFERTTPRRRDEWQALIGLCIGYILLPVGTDGRDPALPQRLLSAACAPGGMGLAGNIGRLYDVAKSLHERLSTDNWRVLNLLTERMAAVPEAPALDTTLRLLDEIAALQMTLTGFMLDGMTRDLGWRFLSVGRHMERLQTTTRLVQRALEGPAEADPEWVLVLGDSIATYRARYLARPLRAPMLDLMWLDDSNPRAIIYQLNGLAVDFRHLPRMQDTEPLHLLQQMRERCAALDAEQDFTAGADVPKLLAQCEALLQESARCSDSLCLRFFSHASAPQWEWQP